MTLSEQTVGPTVEITHPSKPLKWRPIIVRNLHPGTLLLHGPSTVDPIIINGLDNIIISVIYKNHIFISWASSFALEYIGIEY